MTNDTDTNFECWEMVQSNSQHSLLQKNDLQSHMSATYQSTSR